MAPVSWIRCALAGSPSNERDKVAIRAVALRPCIFLIRRLAGRWGLSGLRGEVNRAAVNIPLQELGIAYQRLDKDEAELARNP